MTPIPSTGVDGWFAGGATDRIHPESGVAT